MSYCVFHSSANASVQPASYSADMAGDIGSAGFAGLAAAYASPPIRRADAFRRSIRSSMAQTYAVPTPNINSKIRLAAAQAKSQESK